MNVKDILKGIGTGAACFLGAVLYCCSNSEENEYKEKYTYGDAIDAIYKSDMFSSHKTDAASYVPRNSDPDLYHAIISIANSDAFSSHKEKSIKRICEKYE